MPQRERRQGQPPPPSRVLERLLNPAQIETLRGLEHFGWELKYVRKPLFQDAVPIVLDGNRKDFAIIEPNGALNQKPPFKLRP